jgi:hypothetical protein
MWCLGSAEGGREEEGPSSLSISDLRLPISDLKGNEAEGPASSNTQGAMRWATPRPFDLAQGRQAACRPEAGDWRHDLVTRGSLLVARGRPRG